MWAVVFTGSSSQEEAKEPLKIQKVTRPVMKEDEVEIQVEFFGLNFADVSARKGNYQDAPPFPFVPGYEVSGTITQVGSSVSSLAIGDKVAAFTAFGGYAQYVSTKEIGCFKVPAGMKMEEAAGIPVVFATAYHCIYNTGPVRKGDKCLVHAAAGGVGIAAVQIAKNAGLEVYGTASSDTKLKELKDTWGVDHVINYKEKNFVEEIVAIEGKPKCLDIILDAVGGSQFKQDLELLRAGGRLVAYGAAGLNSTSNGLFSKLGLVGDVFSMLTVNGIDLLMSSISFSGVNMKRISEHRPEVLQECLEFTRKGFESGSLKLHVHKIYDWKQVHEAHQDIESRSTMGKLVIQVTSPFPNK